MNPIYYRLKQVLEDFRIVCKCSQFNVSYDSNCGHFRFPLRWVQALCTGVPVPPCCRTSPALSAPPCSVNLKYRFRPLLEWLPNWGHLVYYN